MLVLPSSTMVFVKDIPVVAAGREEKEGDSVLQPASISEHTTSHPNRFWNDPPDNMDREKREQGIKGGVMMSGVPSGKRVGIVIHQLGCS